MSTHFVKDRVVFTYEPDGDPAGVVTGQEQSDGSVLVEHVIAWKPRVLLSMLRAARHVAREQGYTSIVFYVPKALAQAPGLAVLAARVRCAEYAEDEHFRYYHGRP